MTRPDDVGTVRVLRFDPTDGEPPKWQTFENVPIAGRRVLDVLVYLAEHADSSLGFRESCRIGVCGVCQVTVNGKTVLSCKRPADRDMAIAPPKHATVLKDTAIAPRRAPTPAGRAE